MPQRLLVYCCFCFFFVSYITTTKVASLLLFLFFLPNITILTKPAYASKTKFCRCCCKSLNAYDHHALLFGGESRDEGIAKLFLEITRIEACQNNGFSQYVCRQCSRKIEVFAQFKALCVDSDKKQLDESRIYDEKEGKSFKRALWVRQNRRQ